MAYEIKEEEGFKFLEEGEGPVLMLLHGLFGALSNFMDIVDKFKSNYKVVIPLLPIYELSILSTTVGNLAKHVHHFVEFKKYPEVIVLGNSLGGHVAQLYCLNHPEKIKAMILTGSSGLYENTMGGTFPKRGDYQYIKDKTEYTFYNPKTATKELIDEVYEICNNRNKALHVINMARSAMKENLTNELHKINCPVLLIWGKQDNITPPFVGEDFHKLIKNSELKWIDQCGHAPMMENPTEFNAHLETFLKKISESIVS